MRLFAVCALLLFKVSLGDACASNQFTESGQCCSLCPAGFGAEAQCGKEDTKCAPCPKGTFSSSEGLGPCLPCSKCPRSVPTAASCSAVEDTQCECDNGFFFWREHGLCAPCSKCTRGEGAVRQCGLQGDIVCQMCGQGMYSEEHMSTKSCQACTQCSDSEVEIRSCMPNSDTLCMDKKLHILSRPAEADGTREAPEEDVTEGQEASPSPGTPKFTPRDEGSSNNILAYVSVLAAVVLGLLIYVAYKCWRSCKQKKALSKARAAELGSSPEGEKLQSDSGVFLDSHSLQDNQLSKAGAKIESKQDTRSYVNLPPNRQEEVERLLQEGGGRGWRQLGAALGYEPEQLDLFGRGEAPAHTLLSNWAQKEGSTLGLLCSALVRIERPDVVTGLTCPAQGVSVV
ncbi:tumor necrosis factor receptor superfamily member 16 isoform X1 [Hippoglossus stenolepis]|uniref:tumor necrosis factor receptor superfamily member 16 isoform X1 n=1 Tax=Hippoglossus stenolepis TaxID=195615 RepID=UPI00159C3881|nr:tumor necrosis factor receptor superfamily member 16 isoform X1 [Hippoglossus stenolepis]